MGLSTTGKNVIVHFPDGREVKALLYRGGPCCPDDGILAYERGKYVSETASVSGVPIDTSVFSYL